jgi:uridine monophosphate synthetase
MSEVRSPKSEVGPHGGASQSPKSSVKSFFETLEAVARARESLLCVGLDPRGSDPRSVRDECFRLIDATAEFVCAFKPNSAFFEALGVDGISVLKEVVEHIPADIPVILDAKRGDIADTSEAYARAAFDKLGVHAITVSPYLGGEALTPFLNHPERGAFVLCKTSNPGAGEFQSLEVASDQSLFETVAEHAQQWNVNGNVGLVVGATDVDALARVRSLAPDLWFLVPGVGAQGGDLEAVLKAGLRPDGLGLLINVSRSVARAADPRTEAKRMRDEINLLTEDEGRRTEGGLFLRPSSFVLRQLASDLLTSGCVRFGQFTLKSGIVSPIYIDLRRLPSQPEILRRVARLYAEKLRALNFDRLAGIPYAGLPIATAVALEMNRPLIYPRSEKKEYGTRSLVEGGHNQGEIAVAVDDLITDGGAKVEAIQRLESAGLIVRDVVVLIDREQGGAKTLAAAGYQLHAIVTLRELLEEWRALGEITQERFAEVVAFLNT